MGTPWALPRTDGPWNVTVNWLVRLYATEDAKHPVLRPTGPGGTMQPSKIVYRFDAELGGSHAKSESHDAPGGPRFRSGNFKTMEEARQAATLHFAGLNLDAWTVLLPGIEYAYATRAIEVRRDSLGWLLHFPGDPTADGYYFDTCSEAIQLANQRYLYGLVPISTGGRQRKKGGR